jgi:hypothetical protein
VPPETATEGDPSPREVRENRVLGTRFPSGGRGREDIPVRDTMVLHGVDGLPAVVTRGARPGCE